MLTVRIQASRGRQRPIGMEGEGVHSAAVAFLFKNGVPGAHIPQPPRAVETCSPKVAAHGVKSDPPQSLLMPCMSVRNFESSQRFRFSKRPPSMAIATQPYFCYNAFRYCGKKGCTVVVQ